MTESSLPKGLTGNEEIPIPERIVRWDLSIAEIEQMSPEQLRELAIDHQIMLGRLLDVLRLTTGELGRVLPDFNITVADVDVATSPEKHRKHRDLKDRELR